MKPEVRKEIERIDKLSPKKIANSPNMILRSKVCRKIILATIQEDVWQMKRYDAINCYLGSLPKFVK